VTDTDDGPSLARTYRSARMEALSDGVFAIATTLLVLEIEVPSGADDDLWGAILDEWPSYLAIAVYILVPLGILRRRRASHSRKHA
jgi:uncharacterized membrane protein